MPFSTGLQFKEAIEYAESRNVVLPSEYFGRVNAVQRATSVSIAGLAELNQIKFVIDQVSASIKDGSTFEQFKTRVAANKLDINLPEHRLDNIFRTNIQSAYNRGRWEQQQESNKPYLMYDAVNDSRTRPTHAAWDNTVLAKDHPFWKTHYPPNGYRCRCVVISLSLKQAERRGLLEEPKTAAQPDPGFDGNPGGYEEGPNKLLNRAVQQAEIGTRSGVSGRISKAMRRVADNQEASKLLSTLLTDTTSQEEVLRTLSSMTRVIKTASPMDARLAWSYTRDKSEAIDALMTKQSFNAAESLVVGYIASVFKALNVRLSSKVGTLYHGFDPEGNIAALANSHSEGSIVELGRLLSTSKKYAVAQEFFGDKDQALITVIGAKGTGVDMQRLGVSPTEAEVLLVPGTKYKVLRYKDTIDLETGRHKITIEVAVVGKGEKADFLFSRTVAQPFSAQALKLWENAKEKT